MKKYFSIMTLIVIITTLLLFLYGNIVSGKEKGSISTENVNLEDSIIVKGLEMESEEPVIDNDYGSVDGNIIYDDTFGDAIIDYDTIKNIRRKKKSVKKTSKIKLLKKKDSRWHLTRYKIRKNDNLWKIAKRYGINHRLIIDVNSINNPDRLMPGKFINIPNRNGVSYTIKRGDTLSGISKKFKVKRKKIVDYNNLKSNIIKIGRKIFIPDAVANYRKSRIKSKRKYSGTSKDGICFKWPLRGKLTSRFGRRKDPFSGRRKFHCGIDISANQGKKIRSAAGGRVIFSGWKGAYGKVVILRHKKGYITVYAHNSKNLVKVNDKVKSGQVIAYTGKTGAATGAHLHFEIRKYVSPLNPLRMLR